MVLEPALIVIVLVAGLAGACSGSSQGHAGGVLRAAGDGAAGTGDASVSNGGNGVLADGGDSVEAVQTASTVSPVVRYRLSRWLFPQTA